MKWLLIAQWFSFAAVLLFAGFWVPQGVAWARRGIIASAIIGMLLGVAMLAVTSVEATKQAKVIKWTSR